MYVSRIKENPSKRIVMVWSVYVNGMQVIVSFNKLSQFLIVGTIHTEWSFRYSAAPSETTTSRSETGSIVVAKDTLTECVPRNLISTIKPSSHKIS